MPRPPTRPPAASRRHVVVSLALAALLLSACGGGDDPTPTPQAIQATRAAEPTTTTARPTTTAPERAGDTREPTGEPVTLAFGGDVHFEGAIESRLAADPSTTLGPIAGVLRRADLAMVNLETAITERGTPAPKDFTFRAPPSALTALKEAGVDVATMANNHGEDFGVVGLRDSLAAAREADFPVVGVGRTADEAYRAHRVTVNG
ncbi:MAG TPA: CapA family protein, partial [Actinomycetes bacterium]|nr:CapA family protein [Actinomycetes bacterium]